MNVRYHDLKRRYAINIINIGMWHDIIKSFLICKYFY